MSEYTEYPNHWPPDAVTAVDLATERAEGAEARVRELVQGIHAIRDFASERSFIMAMMSVFEACDVLLTAKSEGDSVGTDQEKNT